MVLRCKSGGGLCLLVLISSMFQVANLYGNTNDSLINSLENTKVDTSKVLILNKLSKRFMASDPDSGIKFAKRALSITQEIYFPKGKAKALELLGVTYYYKDNYPKSLEYFLEALDEYKEIGNKAQIGSVIGNIGSIYYKRGAYDDALAKYHEALKIIEELGKKRVLSGIYNNIGEIYFIQDNYEKSLKNYKKSLRIKRQLNDSSGIALVYNNMGNIFFTRGKQHQEGKTHKHDEGIKTVDGQADSFTINEHFGKAFEYYNKSLNTCSKSDKKGKARAYRNIGLFFTQHGKLDSALYFNKKALRLNRAAKNQEGVVFALLGKGQVYNKQERYKKSIKSFKEAEKIADRIGNTMQLKNASKGLAKAYKETGQYKKAHRFLKQETALKDTLFNKERVEQIQRLELQEKKRQAKKQARLEAKREERRHRVQYSGIFIGLIFLFAFVFLSGKFTLPYKFAEGFIFFNFILLFEYILVILDPYIDHYSGGEPLIKLAANAVLALFIFPAHSFFEEKLKRRVVPGFTHYKDKQSDELKS